MSDSARARLRRRLARSPIGPPVRWMRDRMLPRHRQQRELRQLSRQLDAWTVEVMQQVLEPGSSTVDVGAHAGVLLEHAIRLAPRGRHWAVEPLPDMASLLRERFATATVVEAALGVEPGSARFHHVVERPAYSGLDLRTDLPIENPTVQVLDVEVIRLDDLVAGADIDYLKIDVEGGEIDVLRGGRETLRTSRPIVVVEAGWSTKSEVRAELTALDYAVWTLTDWLGQGRPLDDERLRASPEWMFVAAPREQASRWQPALRH